jgi:nitrate/nitrite transporter NarK
MQSSFLSPNGVTAAQFHRRQSPDRPAGNAIARRYGGRNLLLVVLAGVPAVIARKVSHCSKNERGSEAFAAFTSVARTTVKKSVATVTDVIHRLIKDGFDSPGSS